jgi:hypothetical protein
MECRHRWSAASAIDDETALKVTGETVEVVSEGQWRLFALTTASN